MFDHLARTNSIEFDANIPYKTQQVANDYADR